ncbi:MAG: hemolysin family protein [Candidatus Omnitrophota bacterium]
MKPELLLIMIIALFVLLLFSAFFAMAEVAFVSLNKLRLRYLLNQKKKNAHIVQRIINRMDGLITTILISNNFVNIAISSIGTAIFIYLLGNNFIAIASATVLITLLVLILGEITPKIFAVKHAERIALNIAWLMELIIKLLALPVKIFLGISEVILKFFGMGQTKRSPLITEEEIRLMIELGKEEGVLTDTERKMLQKIFEFGDTQVYAVMIPAEKMVAVDINTTPEKLIDLIVEGGHSRIPVYRDNLNNICGLIYARHLLAVWREKQPFIIEDLLRPAYFIDSKKRVSELLREFQKLRVYIAIVTGEDKNTVGLVTLEDLLEEIVGEIEGDIS